MKMYEGEGVNCLFRAGREGGQYRSETLNMVPPGGASYAIFMTTYRVF